MKFTTIFLLFLVAFFHHSYAQTTAELQATARSFMQQGDYPNAVLVLNRAMQSNPQNIDITKDLAMAYYLERDNNKALEIIKPALDREDTDDQCYQIAGNIYRQLGMDKDCDKLFRKGLKKLPLSGPLHNELGEILWAQQDASAIKEWEKGIEVDAGYSKNYFNACKYYYYTKDNVWAILYGEIFINFEPLSVRTTEIKNVILESYKRLFANADLTKSAATDNKFAMAFIETMNKQSSIASLGINAESLTMIRARFVLDWFQSNAAKYPFQLFNHYQQLLQDGLFDAYNQWVFGSVQNLAAYQNWTIAHMTDTNDFSHFQKSRVFKLPPLQYYRY